VDSFWLGVACCWMTGMGLLAIATYFLKAVPETVEEPRCYLCGCHKWVPWPGSTGSNQTTVMCSYCGYLRTAPHGDLKL
jgi:hypothetical protein